MICKLSYSFGLYGNLFCFAHAVLSRTFILALVGWLVSKLGTFSVGCVLTFCPVCFGGLGGFASLFAVSSLLC
jgi:hypothetical protein